jgi:hypothetical protein
MKNITIYRVQLIKERNVRFENNVIRSPKDVADILHGFLNTYMVPEQRRIGKYLELYG